LCSQQFKCNNDYVFFQQSVTPITWTGYEGKAVSMETVHIQRAKELKELYYIMCQDKVTAKERIELLISLKYAVCTSHLYHFNTT